ncbi:MAG: ABC transporter ATP-binding protein [Candidatus Competibacteraceae bacterium]|nr:ABC transporter ATP-binding protein [Candidatus Competibacteraceae bacterium]
MIETINLNKRFGKLQALNNISVHCQSQHSIALIGPNGCGKTTLIKSILGMVVPDSGNIIFKGKNIKKDYTYRNHIGYMPQIGRYPDNMTIGQVLDMIINIRSFQGALDEDLIHEFGLHQMKDKRMRTLSGGTRQKVSACLSFLFNPDVLILDEPTAGLDPIASEQLKEKIILEKQKGKLILITSHLLSELDDMITQLIFMQEGCLIFHKNIDELRAETGEDRISKAIAYILKNQKA